MLHSFIMKLSLRLLSLMSLGFGLVATGTLSLAVATDYWLFTEEPMPPSVGLVVDYPAVDNMTLIEAEEEDAAAEGEEEEGISMDDFVLPCNSGLWRMCLRFGSILQCSQISYTGQEWERTPGTDTTWAILRSIRKAAPVMIFSLLLELVALGLTIVGNARRDHRTLVGAVIFIFAALCLALGVILYISGVNDEVSHRKKPSNPDGPQFRYYYGWAFFFAGGSFIASMAAAVTNITLYLRRYPSLEDMVTVIPGLSKKSCNINFARVTNSDDEVQDLHSAAVPMAISSHNPTIIL